MKQISKKNSSGFSIIILIIGAVVIGIIVALVIFGYNSITKKSVELIDQTNSSKQQDKTDTADTAATQVGPRADDNSTQKWAKTNLNVGTMITSDKKQTNNSVLEKWCYDDNESNCTTYGALYQWDEAMQYVTTKGAQGICPAGSHIPTDAEWTTLTTYLGSATAGTQLKPGGTSGLNIPLAGYRRTDGFVNLSYDATLWSSSESGGGARYRFLNKGNAPVVQSGTNVKSNGFSVRCLEN